MLTSAISLTAIIVTLDQLAALKSNILPQLLTQNVKQSVLILTVTVYILQIFFEEITKRNVQERRIIFDGKVINKTNRSKDYFSVNVDIVAESTLNFCHDFKPKTFTVAHIDLLFPPTRTSR